MKITAQHRNWLLGGISLYALARSLAANAAERAEAPSRPTGRPQARRRPAAGKRRTGREAKKP